MNYKNYHHTYNEELILRDCLALDRTILANERTFLAYLRTAIMTFATGITLIKIFSQENIFIITGSLLILSAPIIFIFSFISFLKFKKKLNKIDKFDKDFKNK